MASSSLYSEALEKFQQAVLDKHGDPDTKKLLYEFILDGKSNFSTPTAARAAAGNLATDAGQKYGGVKVGKAEVVPKKWIDQVLGNIDSIVAVGGFMMKNAPESVGIAWFAISLTLKAISNNYSLYALFGKGLTDITEVMIIIIHYDRLYDERQTSGFKASDLVDKLFRDTVSAYAAVLDFAFSVKKHMSGGTLDKAKHAFKDFFNTQVPKFQGKLSNIADLKAKVLESSQGAFQDKTMQQFGNIQAAVDQVQRNQSQTHELQLEQRQMMTEMLEDFKELKDSVKRKTPLDYLKEEFMANKKKLAPLPDPSALVDTLLTKKYDDTCKWILQNDSYQAWSKFDQSAILCLVGGPRSGKSTIIASIIQQLTNDEENRALFVNCVFCVGNDSSQTTALEGQRLSRIYNTLLYQIYDLADEQDDKISLLDTCNQVFRNSKSHQAGSLLGKGSQSDGNPEFVDAMSRFVNALQRNTVLVIDGIDSLNSEDQSQLQRNLVELINDTSGPQKIFALIGTRSDSTFLQRSKDKLTCIDVSGNIQADLETVLDSRLRELSGWSDIEKQQAKESVLNKAGTRFDYINDVAMPFLEQPFQRPIAKYLSRLPEGMNESFEQAFQSMPQNYFELLRIAVTWSLLAPRKVTVKEIIEAYSGTYTVDEPNGTMIVGANDDAYEMTESALEMQQIRGASGPFLSTETNEIGQTVIILQNPRQLRMFCQHTAQSQPKPCEENAPICDNCKSPMAKSSRLAIDPKVAHYEIALTLLKHLNSPLFQRRFGLLRSSPVNDGSGDPDYTETNGATDPSIVRELKEAELPAPISGEIKEQDVSGQVSDHPTAKDNPDLPPPDENSVDKAKLLAPEGENAGDKTDDDDRHSELSVDGGAEGYDYDRGSPYQDFGVQGYNLYDYAPELRCEINNWPYHLREAEKLWPVEERQISEVWMQLNRGVQEELSKFANNKVLFETWQEMWSTPRKLGYWNEWRSLKGAARSPLFFAACLGLSTWAEAILDDGADVNEISDGFSIMQASADLAAYHQNVDLLRLLLRRGADPHYYIEDECPSGLNGWIYEVCTLSVVQAFADHEVDFGIAGAWGYTSLHIFAWRGNDLEAFDLMMHPKNPSKKPDINAETEEAETPLHSLLGWRKDVPLDMLEAFLNVEGIDVNHEDKWSHQPLAAASSWGSLAIIKLLLQAGADVHDQSKTGWVALHWAARGNHVKCIEALLAAGSELEAKDKFGSTALHHAALIGRKNAVELLISKGSDVNGTTDHNRTPLFNATRCQQGGQETAQSILTELKRRGYSADEINKVTKGGRTPLRQAAYHGFADVLQELLEYINESKGAEVRTMINRADKKLQRTALHCAALRGHFSCVKLLMKYGADVTLKDSEDKTALTYAQELLAQAYESSHEDLVLCLIEASPEAAIADAELPSIAAAIGSMQVLQKLHGLRADLHRPDSLGWTPLAHAKQGGHKKAERFLKHETRWGGIFPSTWVDKDSRIILDENDLRLTYNKGEELICIVSNKPLPPSMERFYYEITLERLEGDGELAMGFCTLGAAPHRFPGWIPKTEYASALGWAYHSDDGGYYHANDAFVARDETYGPGDTVGCGVNLETHKIWFTKNGKKLAHEFGGVKGRLFPILGLNDTVTLKTNFGQEAFVWKDEQLVNGTDGTY